MFVLCFRDTYENIRGTYVLLTTELLVDAVLSVERWWERLSTKPLSCDRSTAGPHWKTRNFDEFSANYSVEITRENFELDKRVKSLEKNGWSRISKEKILVVKIFIEKFSFKPNIFGRNSADFFSVLLTKSWASSLNDVGKSYFSCVTLFNVPWTAKNS